VASEWVLTGSETEPLFEQEARALPEAVDKRKREYRAGRHCARRALQSLGFAGAPILRRADRTPIWPSGSVGSIAHTGKGDSAVALAAVARAEHRRSLGIDIEQSTALNPDLYSRVLTAREQSYLEKQELFLAGTLAKLSFSAKEAYYKCQYPLTGQFLDFTDVELHWDLAARRFEAHVLRADFECPDLKTVGGRYLLDDKLMVCSVELENP
jgi:4'-phosphopantetheinyl transferase EntD